MSKRGVAESWALGPPLSHVASWFRDAKWAPLCCLGCGSPPSLGASLLACFPASLQVCPACDIDPLLLCDVHPSIFICIYSTFIVVVHLFYRFLHSSVSSFCAYQCVHLPFFVSFWMSAGDRILTMTLCPW